MRTTPRDVLSPRQMETLRAIAEGRTDREIARAMLIAECTAGRHVRDLLCKLDARNRAHAVHVAHERGLL